MTSPTLLIADDSLTIRRVIEVTFADQDIRVVAVADGREAIARITAEPPDVILADIGMPERDGYEVAAFVKTTAHLAHIPVLLLTGALEPLDQARARQAGYDGELVKPFEPPEVIARVRALLARRPAPASPDPANRGGDPGPATAPPASGASRGDYLDRLDAAFAAMTTRPVGTGAMPMAPEQEDGERTWIPEGSSRDSQPSLPSRTGLIQHTVSTASSEDPRPAGPSLSEAFAALLAAEQGRPSPSGPLLPALALPEATLDEIARRVVVRLGQEPMRQAVLDAADRLVREEIDRIKGVQRKV